MVRGGYRLLEMALSVYLAEKALSVEGIAQWPYKAVASV